MKLIFTALSLAFIGCSRPVISLPDLESAFAKPEYIASNDGWAEARRRTLLKKFLQGRNISFRESTSVLRGKYNRVVIHAGGNSRNKKVVTLVLPPGPGVVAAQGYCDKVLFAELRKRVVVADFAMTDTCVVDR